MASRDEVFALDQHRKNLGKPSAISLCGLGCPFSALGAPCLHALTRAPESRIIALQQQLSAYPKKLVDEEGFPLANVDVRACSLCTVLPSGNRLPVTPASPPGAHGSKSSP